MTLLFWLLLAHLVCDYPLQSDFVAKFKARANSLGAVPWYYVMAGHAGMHAAAVGLLTASPLLAALEFAAHFVTDVLKCEGYTNIHQDQAYHVLAKVVWVLLFHTL